MVDYTIIVAFIFVISLAFWILKIGLNGSGTSNNKTKNDIDTLTKDAAEENEIRLQKHKIEGNKLERIQGLIKFIDNVKKTKSYSEVTLKSLKQVLIILEDLIRKEIENNKTYKNKSLTGIGDVIKIQEDISKQINEDKTAIATFSNNIHSDEEKASFSILQRKFEEGIKVFSQELENIKKIQSYIILMIDQKHIPLQEQQLNVLNSIKNFERLSDSNITLLRNGFISMKTIELSILKLNEEMNNSIKQAEAIEKQLGIAADNTTRIKEQINISINLPKAA